MYSFFIHYLIHIMFHRKWTNSLDFLIDNGLSDEGAVGLMGNLQAISGLQSIKYDDTYKNQLGLTDQQYVDKS